MTDIWCGCKEPKPIFAGRGKYNCENCSRRIS